MSAEEAVKNETMDTETGENAAAQDDEDERKFFRQWIVTRCQRSGNSRKL